ncbi:MAG: 1-deoxy-D-xylulose-5-phosphate reductoisomerase [Lachnospiraceae bacterium]|nr:1-deoxy-D-xylulose-5-phosphate reductoisomerase [Lachnospiraceae bacterium]
MKKISLLGSTGSIGTQTLEIARAYPDELGIVALAARSSVDAIVKQALEFKPSVVAMFDGNAAARAAEALSGTGIRVVSGMDGLIEAASLPEADIVVTALVGMIGIRPTIEAIKSGHDIALANKETLVCAGHIIMPLVRECNVSLYPVDSEHSAIFQSLNGEHKEDVERIILTASGGPFRTYTKEMLEKVTAADALRHPNWNMGSKITIDSATLVNKGLEVMEACHLFGVGLDDIEVVIHPQSVIHSAVKFRDGAVMAEMGCPDMKLPIAYALFYPRRVYLDTKRLDLFELQSMTFEKPDPERFPGFAYAYEAARAGGIMPTVFNAANERAVALFLEGRIGFTDIARLIRHALDRATRTDDPTVDDILEAEAEAARSVSEACNIPGGSK